MRHNSIFQIMNLIMPNINRIIEFSLLVPPRVHLVGRTWDFFAVLQFLWDNLMQQLHHITSTISLTKIKIRHMTMLCLFKILRFRLPVIFQLIQSLYRYIQCLIGERTIHLLNWSTPKVIRLSNAENKRCETYQGVWCGAGQRLARVALLSRSLREESECDGARLSCI